MKSPCESVLSGGSYKRTGVPPPPSSSSSSTSRPADSHEDRLPILLESTPDFDPPDLDPPDLEVGLGGLILPVDSKSDGRRMWSEPSIEFRKGSEEEEDPYLEEDLSLEDYLPEEYKNAWFCAMILLGVVLIIGSLVCTLAIPALKRKNLWMLKMWKWEILVLVLISGSLVSSWVIRLLVFFIERNFPLRKRLLYFVYRLRKTVKNCLWWGLVLIVWHALVDKKAERETNSDGLEYVTKVLVCLLVGTVLWLVKTLIITALASSFHMSTNFDRIQESLFNQDVIVTLMGPPITADHLRKLKPKNVSAWNIKRSINIVQHGFLSTLYERLQEFSLEDVSAAKIFRYVAKHNSKFIYLEDLMRFMTEDEALKTMSLFEGADECKGISKSCLKKWLVREIL